MRPALPEVASGPRLDLVLVSVEQLLSRDGQHTPVPLPHDDPHDVLHPARAPLGYRIAQVRADPAVNPWLLRLAVRRSPGPTIVGHANFHGPPDERGMVELGYLVLPPYRHQGFGREMAQVMWALAAAHPEVRVLRASVSPGNQASLRIIEGEGLVRVGEQLDPEDGLEWLFERVLR